MIASTTTREGLHIKCGFDAHEYYSYELDMDPDRHRTIFDYTDEQKTVGSKMIRCCIKEYDELIEMLKSRLYIPNLPVFSGGGEDYCINVAMDLGILVCSFINEKTTYISELNGKIKESSGYLLFTVLKSHLNRYIFSNGQIPIHAALLSDIDENDGRGIVIMGESGAGKSTLCYRINEDLGYHIYSDDLAVYNPDKNEVYAYCRQFFLNEDMVIRYNLEDRCKKKNSKYGIYIGGNEIKTFNRVDIVFLKKNADFHVISLAELETVMVGDNIDWCRTKAEEKKFADISLLFESAKMIVSGSYLCTDRILEVLKSEARG